MSTPRKTIPVDARSPAMERALERVAWLMDRAFTVPGTNVTFGLDALLGLFPGLGDVATGVIQSGIVLAMMLHYKVPKPVVARMAANVLLDVGVGAIPIVGDVFDVFFKANTRNMALLREVQAHQQRGEPMPAGPSVRYLILMGALLGGALVLILGASIYGIVWLFNHPPTFAK